jgi:uncharacterized protein YndB with AHSA1/START domain
MTVTAPTDLDVVVTRVVDAPRRLVWEAWTKPVYLSQWLLGPPGWTMPVCEVDLRPGGTWRHVWRRDDGSEFGINGVYREIVAPERMVCTESWGGDWADSVNTLVLTETAGRTTVTLTISYPSKEARDAAMQTGMTDGMAASYDRLAELLKTMI